MVRNDKSGSQVSADLLSPRFQVRDRICMTFILAAINTTQVTVTFFEEIQQLNGSDLVFDFNVHILVNGSSVQKVVIPIATKYHYMIISARESKSCLISILDVELTNQCGAGEL